LGGTIITDFIDSKKEKIMGITGNYLGGRLPESQKTQLIGKCLLTPLRRTDCSDGKDDISKPVGMGE
jgi:hypothetical protein